MPSGFRFPEKIRPSFEAPADATFEEAFAALKVAVERLRATQERVPHPVMGKLSLEEWEQFHLRHAEMHLSFVNPSAA